MNARTPQTPPTGGAQPAAPAPQPAPPKPESEPQGERGNGAGASSGPPTVLEHLREKRARINEDRRLKLDVPGYGGSLVAEYRPLPYRDMTKSRKRVNQRGSASDPEDELRFGASALARACDCMYVRLEEGAEPVPLHEQVEQFGDEPVRYDERLAEALNIELSNATRSATGILRLVFKNSYALVQHFDAYDAWNASSEDDKDF